MTALTAGPARGAALALATVRQQPANGGLALRFCWRQLAVHNKTLHLCSVSALSSPRPSAEPLVSLTATRWLPRGPISPLSSRLSVFEMASAGARPLATSSSHHVRKTSSLTDKGDDPPPEKPSIFKRFKQMYKDYWYVLVPVHLATSAVWFGSFYYASKSGIDVAGILESWGFSQTITDKLRNSAAGHIAVAYALYKLATPARYTVTLGGTTYSIKFLSERGYIKPVPSRQEMRDMYQDRRDEFREQSREWREKYMERRREWREKFQERRKHGWRKK
ncbi:Protein FAM210A [Amphibalanus amphitrite]|uniref:Protein FAM210A n=1 Tax=Amphibalanus amphitrite TaxID=1232801 RepID=A0A6A4VS65_AMPAM|nr:Protein FAM210A [Amphibalanus amphitrite]KAF0297576.1 Protein FAM210A [Amphibalanus amphitrite]